MRLVIVCLFSFRFLVVSLCLDVFDPFLFLLLGWCAIVVIFTLCSFCVGSNGKCDGSLIGGECCVHGITRESSCACIVFLE